MARTVMGRPPREAEVLQENTESTNRSVCPEIEEILTDLSDGKLHMGTTALAAKLGMVNSRLKNQQIKAVSVDIDIVPIER